MTLVGLYLMLRDGCLCCHAYKDRNQKTMQKNRYRKHTTKVNLLPNQPSMCPSSFERSLKHFSTFAV